MPYYFIQLDGGNIADLNELKEMFADYRLPDHGSGNTILVNRPYDLETLCQHVSGVGGPGTKFVCGTITKKKFDWKKHQ